MDSIEAPGDGSSQLRLAAVGTSRHLDILRPLWPIPPFNLMGRTLRINCLKVVIVQIFTSTNCNSHYIYEYNKFPSEFTY